jgi:hypothetical protein
MTDNYDRLVAMAGGIWFISDRVNLNDLCNAVRPGSIVRCDGIPSECVTYIPGDEPALGCVAGWISEDD